MFKALDSKQQIKLVFGIFVVFTAIELVNLFTGRMLNQFGNIPRYVPGLTGILFGPFLHGGIQHYFSNIIPLCIFSYLLLQYGIKRYVYVTIWIITLTGILVWLFARPATHIGVSGVVYGYFGYLLLAGFLSGKFKLIVISLLVGFFYGGLIFGVLPSRPFVSWESHLFGFIGGLVAAKFWATPSKI
ncbi:rhomboid family intramembrane serine protease [Paraglaciecola aquimarina]|uniref:Rhomboid family intramembrane serine protease n=1 Tax=Paraglaciecola algarum TaxID=3050085 RepID=A0ABS9D4A4_9ALTE|nr:rhomboid family intramembrane serine protease [Paraglaciecola sp. G1-23]MCF2947721.1 rhomboid family intramembrane serine protease [Paraglaciecola sp. G1-23]